MLLLLVFSSWYLSHDVSIGHVETILIQFTVTGNRHTQEANVQVAKNCSFLNGYLRPSPDAR